MENAKKDYILKSGVNKVIPVMLRILWISIVLLMIYPQHMCRSSEKIIDNKIDISEKIIKKETNFLNEDIKAPIFIKGINKTNVENINSIVYKVITDRIGETERSVAEEFNGINEKPTFPYEIKSTFVVTEKSDSIISLYNDYYEFLGGAHGSTIRNGYTVDRNLEKILGLRDMFLEGYDYKSVINSKIKEDIRKEQDKYFNSAEDFQGINDNQGFYIHDGNVIIFYQQYEIAPYVAGIPEFIIPISDFNGNFKYNV